MHHGVLRGSKVDLRKTSEIFCDGRRYYGHSFNDKFDTPHLQQLSHSKEQELNVHDGSLTLSSS